MSPGRPFLQGPLACRRGGLGQRGRIYLRCPASNDNGPRRRGKRSSSGTPGRRYTLFRGQTAGGGAAGLCRSTCGNEWAGMSSLGQTAQRTLAGPLSGQGWPLSLQDLRSQSGCTELSRRRRSRPPPRSMDRPEAGSYSVRAVGRPVVGDDHEAATDHPSWVLGTLQRHVRPHFEGVAAVGHRLHGRRGVHHGSARSRSVAEVHEGLCLGPLARHEECGAGQSA